MFRPRPNTKTFSATFRGLSSLPMRRPRRLWDMHLPKTTWDYCPRETEPRHCTPGHLLERARSWVFIPDVNLPEPWTCNWAKVEWTAEVRPLEATLASQYVLCRGPLTPVMCNPPKMATVFACASTGKFFLYHREWHPPWAGGPRKEFRVHAFEGRFPSVEAFIEQADWNRMELMDPVELMQQAPEVPSSITGPALALMGEQGFRVAAQEPYQKRTLWEMCPPQGTLGYIPRQLPDRDPDDYPGVSEWPRTPDAVLPEPWSADWRAFARAFEWHGEVQANLEKRYGHALAGLVPAMFEPADDYPPDTVLCPPGGAGTYYLWGSPLRWEMSWRAQTVPEMQRFRGQVFANVEDFVRTADWNSLEEVAVDEAYWSR